MPIDTRDKRASSIGSFLPSRGLFPNPTGSSPGTAAGRQQVAMSYSGLLAGLPVAPTNTGDPVSFFTMSDGYSVTGGGDRPSTISVSSGFSFFGM